MWGSFCFVLSIFLYFHLFFCLSFSLFVSLFCNENLFMCNLKKKCCSCLSVLALAVGLVPEWVMCKRPASQKRWSLSCMGRTTSFSQVLASGRWLAEIGNLIRVTQRQCVSSTWRSWSKETRQVWGGSAPRDASWHKHLVLGQRWGWSCEPSSCGHWSTD